MNGQKPKIWTPLKDTLCICTRMVQGKHNRMCIFSHHPERVEAINEAVQKLRDRNAELRAKALGSDQELVRVNIAQNLLWYIPHVPTLSHGVTDLIKHTQEQMIQNLVAATGGETRTRWERHQLIWTTGGRWAHEYDLEPEPPEVARAVENPWTNPDYFYATIPGEGRAKALTEALLDFTKYLEVVYRLGYLEGMDLLMRLYSGDLTLPSFEGGYDKARVLFGRALMELRLRFLPEDELKALEEKWHRAGSFARDEWMDREAKKIAGVPLEED